MCISRSRRAFTWIPASFRCRNFSNSKSLWNQAVRGGTAPGHASTTMLLVWELPEQGVGSRRCSPTPRTHLFIQQAPSPCPHQSLNPTGRIWVFLQLRAKQYNCGHTKLTPSPSGWVQSTIWSQISHFHHQKKPKVHTCCINIYICAYIHTYTHVMPQPTPSARGGPCSVSSPSPALGSPVWWKLGKNPISMYSITASVMSTLDHIWTPHVPAAQVPVLCPLPGLHLLFLRKAGAGRAQFQPKELGQGAAHGIQVDC